MRKSCGVISLLVVPVVFLGMVLAAHARSGQIERGDNFPKAPFKPHSIYVAKNSEKLCRIIENRAKMDFFGMHPDFDPDSIELSGKESQIETLVFSEQAGIQSLLNIETVEYPRIRTFEGDIDGDGEEEIVLLTSSGGANNTNYSYFRHFIKYSAELAQSIDQSVDGLRQIGASQQEIWRYFYDLQQELVSRKLTLASLKNEPSERVKLAARTAYRMLGKTTILKIDSRIYVEVHTPDKIFSERVLLSFDGDLNPQIECVVAMESSRSAQDAALTEVPTVDALWKATEEMIGARKSCQRGTSKPFAYLRWRTLELRHDLLFQPWDYYQRIVGGRRGKEMASIFGSGSSIPLDHKKGFWKFHPSQFIWSLEGVYNRRASLNHELLATAAIDELNSYYQRSFDFDQNIQGAQAAFYIAAIRLHGTGDGVFSQYYEPYHAGLLRMRDRGASVLDFLILASGNLELASRSEAEQAEMTFHSSFYTKALSLAVGADAPAEIIEELVDRGANINGAGRVEPPIMNAVDRPALLGALLELGAKPDARNGFGKNALMMSAHMNQVDSATELLKAGADVNAQTLLEFPEASEEDKLYGWNPDCEYRTVRYRQRTALMYAAENGSLEMIRVLVDVGADLNPVDSRGRDIGDYLRRNRILDDSEKATIIEMLDAQNRPE